MTEPTSDIVPVKETSAIVQTEKTEETPDMKRETEALIEAIKKRAQAEIQAAGDITRDAYLEAVRKARVAVEESDLIIERSKIEESVAQIQKEAEKNWQYVVNEIESLGSRLTDVAKSAWESLVSFLPKSGK